MFDVLPKQLTFGASFYRKQSAVSFGIYTGNDMMGNTDIELYLLDSQFGGL